MSNAAKVISASPALSEIAKDCKSPDPQIAATARLNLILCQDHSAWLKEEIDRGTPEHAILHATVAAAFSCIGTALLSIPLRARSEAIDYFEHHIAAKWKITQDVTAGKSWYKEDQPHGSQHL